MPIERPAQALVRETIQNSLDARANGEAVKARFYVSGAGAALPSGRAARWLGEAWPHFRSVESGLRGIPEEPEPCRFLVVEDFSTRGLEGDPTASDRFSSDKRNHFYAFFRAEGVSQNTGGRGKWGVGKTVFHGASRVHAMLGLTVRLSDRKRLLMGQAILRFHRVGQAIFAADGMFGTSSHDLISPIVDTATLDAFCNDFRLTRTVQPGLSVVVPYCEEDVTASTIVEAVRGEYFYPLIAGKLVVEVVDGATGETTTLDGTSVADRCGDPELGALIALARWAHELQIGTAVILPEMPVGQGPFWHDGLFSGLDRLATTFERGEPVAVDVPIMVPTRAGGSAASSFRVVLQRDLKGRGYKPIFIRNGIIVPEATERRLRGLKLFSLVLVEDGALSNLLGDAETPAHTHWSAKTANFRGRYGRSGRACLDFVKSAPRSIAEFLGGARRERNRLALAQFFPQPSESDGLPEVDSEADDDSPDGKAPKPPRTFPPRTPAAFVLERIRGGFRVKRGEQFAPLPPALDIAVAYDCSRGNPLSKYSFADFQLGALQKELVGVQELHCEGNRLRVALLQPDFAVEVNGLDVNRDVYVRVRPAELPND
jgi:hypothetical protein